VNRRGTAVLAVACLALAVGAGATAVAANAATTEVSRAAKAAASSGHWTAPVLVPGLAALNVGQNAGLNDIACAAGGNCAAGGSYTDKAGDGQAWIASEVGGHWHSAQEVPGTAAMNTGGNATVNVVSCLAPGHCLAVGETANAAHTQSAFVSTEAGNGTWTTATPIADGMNASEMSCPGAGDCILGGATTADQATVSQAAVSVENGAAWSAPRTLPGVAALAPDGSAVTVLTCTSPGNCLAGGTYVPNHPHLQFDQLVFVASEVKGVWQRAVPLPGAARLNTGHQAYILAVSCASAGNCSVGGYDNFSNGLEGSFAANEVRGGWDAARAIPGATSGLTETVTGLRCTAAATCLAVGAAGGNGLIAAEKNGIWGKNRLVPDYDYGTTVTAISCRSAGNCLATGYIMLPGEDSYYPGNESFGIAEINGIWGPVKFLTVANEGTTNSAVQSCDRNGDCSIGGTIQYTAPGLEEAAGFSPYVASYTP
jgi:hypothetical protein